MHTAIIAKGYTLHLEPGVKLQFAPGVMLAINGTLIAKVDKPDGYCIIFQCSSAGDWVTQVALAIHREYFEETFGEFYPLTVSG